MLGFGRALGETMAVTMVIGKQPARCLVIVRPAAHDGRRRGQRVHGGERDLYLSALVEIGLVLFIITLIVNGLSGCSSGAWTAAQRSG